MGWKTIKGHEYYYRSRRRGKAVISEYVGGGYGGTLMAQLDAHERDQAEQKRQQWQTVKAEQAALDRQIDELGDQVRQWVTAALYVAGCHRHHRQWRKQGMGQGNVVIAYSAPVVAEAQRLNELITLVDKGKPTPEQRAELARYLAEIPEIADLLANTGRTILRQLGERMFPPAGALAFAAKLNDLRRELLLGGNTALDRLLIDQVVLCQAQLLAVEWRFHALTNAQYSMPEGEHWEKRLSAAQRRYLRALESLARVRKLGVNIQVNIGDKQVITG